MLTNVHQAMIFSGHMFLRAVTVENIDQLRGFQIELHYDANLFELKSLKPNQDLEGGMTYNLNTSKLIIEAINKA